MRALANKLLTSRRINRFAYLVSLACSLLFFDGMVYVATAHISHDMHVEVLEQQRAFAIKAELIRQTVCLTNIVHHESRGEKPHVRTLVGKVVLAMATDPHFSKAKNPCDLAKIGGMFSQIKYVSEVRTDVHLWPTVYTEMTELMQGDKSLPAGWGCVRAFRLSDSVMEKLSPKAIHQLGFTVHATGLKYFAAKLVPIGTEGRITFYSAREGCKKPTRTVQRS